MVNIKAGVLGRALAAGLVSLLISTGAGCASAAVQRGALIGAGSGALLGLGTGVLVSDPDLLGSPGTAQTGDLSLGTGEAVGASVAIGVVFGALVGAMIGHASDDELGGQAAGAAAPDASAQMCQAAPVAF